MVWFALAFGWLLGLVWLFGQTSLPNPMSFLTAGLALVAVMALVAWRGRRWPQARAGVAGRVGLSLSCLALAAAPLAIGWGTVQSEGRLSHRLEAQSPPVDETLVLEIQDLPIQVERGRRWVQLEAVVVEGARRGARLWVIWPVETGPWPSLVPGQVWSVPLRPRNLTGSRNRYGFDFETWLFQKGIMLSGSVLPRASPKRLDQSPSLQGRIDALRFHIREDLRQALESPKTGQPAPYWGVLAGLTVGDQGSISADDWRVFSLTGISHLVSISGMHVTMFALMARWLIGLLWRLLSRPPLRLGLWIPGPLAKAVGGSLAALGYALLAGFNIPAQRTAVMVVVLSACLLLGGQGRPWPMLALTLLVLMVWDSTAVLAPGFWLSFFAVAILFAQPSGLGGWRGALRAQWSISIGLAPLTIVLFQQVSLVGPLANALAIPVVTFVVTPLAFLGTLANGLGWPDLLWLGHEVFAQLQSVMRWMADWPLASLRWSAPPLWAGVAACLGAALLVQAGLGRHRWWGLVGLCGLLVGQASAPPPGQFQVHFFDVGQGSSVLVRTAQRSLLFDTGPSMGASHAAERIVTAQLVGLGLRTVDGLVLSHQDDDHASGAQWIVDHFKPRWVLASLPTDHGLKAWEACQAGQSWTWDEVVFRVVHPFAHDGAEPMLGRNEDSCVVEVRDQAGRRLLLTGDIPTAQEADILARQPWLQARAGDQTIVLAAHHGSKGSSGAVWLQQLRPDWLVVQAGYRNRFGHPHADVLARGQAAGAAIARTDLQGGLVLHWQAGSLTMESIHAQTRRFWHLDRLALRRD